MSNQPDQLSQLLLEADGLLLLLHRHRDETPIDAINLLRRKLQLIIALTDGLEDEETSSNDAQEWIEDTVENPTVPEDKTVIASTVADESEPNVQTIDNSVNPHEVNILDKVDMSSTTEDHDTTVKDDVESYIESTVEDSSEPVMYTPVEKPVILEDEVVFMNETHKEIERTFIDDVPIYKPRLSHIDESGSSATPSGSDVNATRRPVSSVFNLNDKFRFRRELFGNSDAQYVECLDLLSAMTSIDEAKEYLYDDLSWDPDNEDVKAFVELLQNYYKY